MRGRRLSSPGFALLAAALWVVGPARAAESRVGDIRVETRGASAASVGHGYVAYRVSLTNVSRLPRRVTLTLPDETYGTGAQALREMRRAVTVGPFATLNVSLLQPPVAARGSGLGVAVEGGAHATVPFNVEGAAPLLRYPSAGSAETAGAELRLLASKSVSGDALKAATGMPENTISRWELPLEEWDTSWLAYSCFDGLVLPGRDLAAMPPAVRGAIESYVEAGGTLLALGGFDAPKGWARVPSARGTAGFYYAGFGQCVVTPTEDPSAIPEDDWKEIRESLWRTLSPWREHMNAQHANDQFPVVKSVRVPVRGLFVLILVFAAAIGPVNLIVLSRLKKRMLLLLTVPALSILTSAAVYAYALLSEGLSRYARADVVTLLDEGAHRATTLGYVGYYSPLTPGGGLRFTPDTELTLLGSELGGSPLSMDWTEAQQLTGGWIRARIPTHFQVRKSELRRERLAVSRESSGALSAVNGLGADLESVWYADEGGRVHTAGGVAAGARVALERTPGSARGTPEALRNLYRFGWVGTPERLVSNPQGVLLPGTYVAVLKGSPFVEEALAGVSRRKGRSVVYGVTRAD